MNRTRLVLTAVALLLTTAPAIVAQDSSADRLTKRYSAFEVDVLVNGRPLREYYERGRTYIDAVHGAEYELQVSSPGLDRKFYRDSDYQKFIGQIEAILHEGAARGELRPMDTHLATWIMLGMIYPFFGAAPDPEQTETEQAIELMLTVFFDGATP